MGKKHHKTIDFILYTILPAYLIHNLFLLLLSNTYQSSTLLFALLTVCVLLTLSWCFYKTQETDGMVAKALHQIWMLLFVVYVLQLAYLLFFSAEFSRDSVNFLSGSYVEALSRQWQYGTNLKPFYTIQSMLSIFDIPGIANRFAIINLVGNLIAFMPFAFFLPKLFMKMRKTWRFMGLMALLIVLVEITQFFTLTGSMDIDDFILNFLGVALVYLPLRSIIVKKTL